MFIFKGTRFMKNVYKVFLISVLATVANIEAMELSEHDKNLQIALQTISKAAESELTQIKAMFSDEEWNQHHPFSRVEVILKRNEGVKEQFATAMPKIVYAINHDLSKEQRDIVVNLLYNLKALSACSTTNDLMLAANVCLTYDGRAQFNKACDAYFQNEQKSANSAARVKQLDKADLKNVEFNALKNYMCKASALEGFSRVRHFKFDDITGTFMQQYLESIGAIIALPFVVFNDFYFFSGWELAFKQCAEVFTSVNQACDQLLMAIK
jgi:hypothetical protein